jgi:hypothetical protein
MKQKRTLFRRPAIWEIVLMAMMSAMMATAEAGDSLYAGTQLNMGQSIGSSQGKYNLIMQADGNLVMYRSDGTVRSGSAAMAGLQSCRPMETLSNITG